MINKNYGTRVYEFLAGYFQGNPQGFATYWALWVRHSAANLAGAHFVEEFTGGSKPKFMQRVWEMVLGQHLIACGHEITTRPEGQPDYRFELGGRVVWVEAISPEPGPDLPEEWTTYILPLPKFQVGTFPHKELLLRWTGAFKEKARKFCDYKTKGVVAPSDICVIAIDGSQLSKMPTTHGIPQVPFIVETVFPIGPLAIEVNRETGKLGSATHTVQRMIETRNQSPVYKEPFLRPEFSGISAVLGAYGSSGLAGSLPLQVAYNPLAKSPLRPGRLGESAEEWGAKLVLKSDDEQEWDVFRF